MLLGLPLDVAHVFRDHARFDLDRRLGPVDRKGDGIDPVVGGGGRLRFVPAAGGEKKQSGQKDHRKRKQMR